MVKYIGNTIGNAIERTYAAHAGKPPAPAPTLASSANYFA